MAKKKTSKKKTSKRKVSKKSEPINLSRDITKYENLDMEINKLLAKVSKLEDKKEAIAESLQSKMKAAGTDKARNPRTHVQVTLAHMTVYNVKDGRWNDLYKYIHKHKAYDLLHRRLGKEAVEERFGEKLPVYLQSFDRTSIRMYRP